ncbi:hypothetical protein [Caballeronia sp. LZ001]|uniref:hypothetical protein n=1 Tax=Caballeronia sp. LZ001 TaxID=3038553 RepID=UPI00285A77A9|nr:hypothetical protein [Caballeronia sp. LZ001]MDR5800648.1 hypothetical protein [Caballeronia sp. LZ001]
MNNEKAVTREEFEGLQQSLLGTWTAIGHILVETQGKERAFEILQAAEESASTSQRLPVFHLTDEALHYIRLAVDNSH